MFYTPKGGLHAIYIPSADERRRKEEERERQRQARSDAWHSTWITVWRLKHDRLWTDGMIVKALGKPRKRGKYKVFPVPLVREAESKPEFQAWLAPRLEKTKAKNPYFEILPLPEAGERQRR